MKRSLSRNETLGACELRSIFKKAKKLKMRGFSLYLLENNSKVHRFGVSVSKKYGTAVQRNYAKRVVREVYRLNRNKLSKPCDVVFVVYPHELNFAAACGTLTNLMEKACAIGGRSAL